MRIRKIAKLKYLLLAPVAAAVLGLTAFTQDDNDDFELVKNLEIFHTLMRDVRILYVDETSSGELIKTAMDDMLKTLDPYTVYYPESLVEDVMFMNTGEYAGIGADMEKFDGVYHVMTVSKGSPAELSGIMIGDIVTRINDKDIKDKTVDDISLIMKGQPGTPVSITYERDGQTSTVNIKRAMIKEKAIPYYGVIADKTGYINLSGFTEGCSKELKDAFLKLKNDNKIEKLVIDLRYNPGGLLIEAVNIVNLFVDKGEKVVQMRGRVEEWNKTFTATNNPIDTKIPIVVLVNGNSASAAEIVSGSLQDLDRAVIIGAKTFGKGLVQTTKDLAFNSKLKITTAKYYIPSGRCIQKLDYSHKDSTGKATQYTEYKTFHTKNGREVKDAGGIMPDIKVDSDTLSYIVSHLIDDNIIYGFATKYRRAHSEIKNPEDFELSDEELQEFKNYCGAKLFEYQTKSDVILKELQEAAKEDKQPSEVLENLNQLAKTLNKEKEQEYQKNLSEIRTAVSTEIISRYYNEEGVIRYNLQHDPFVSEGIRVLNDAILYKKVLENK